MCPDIAKCSLRAKLLWIDNHCFKICRMVTDLMECYSIASSLRNLRGFVFLTILFNIYLSPLRPYIGFTWGYLESTFKLSDFCWQTEVISSAKKFYKGQRCSSVLEHLHSILKAPSLAPSTTRN
jgi:hypothetical protein